MLAEDRKLAPMRPYRDFREASAMVLRLLQERIGMGLWLVTRTEGEDWIVLDAADRDYGVGAGDVFRWSDSFCSRMVQGLGPRIAPRVAEVPEYAAAPIGRQVEIGAYVGVPLLRADGSLFGTLCAIDPEPRSDSLSRHLPVVEVYSRLLATILESELVVQEQARRAERAEAESEKDELTGLFNRRGWKRLREGEEARCRRYGSPAGIIVVDLDGLKAVNDEQGHAAGDELLSRTADVLRASVRSTDVVARLGGDEFAVLAVEEPRDGLARLLARVEEALAGASIRASVGAAARRPQGSLKRAQERADADMYERKRAVRGNDR